MHEAAFNQKNAHEYPEPLNAAWNERTRYARTHNAFDYMAKDVNHATTSREYNHLRQTGIKLSFRAPGRDWRGRSRPCGQSDRTETLAAVNRQIASTRRSCRRGRRSRPRALHCRRLTSGGVWVTPGR